VTIRVAIADDHSLVRQGLRRYLDMADGIDVVGEASNGKELLELIGNENPDIALIDIRMPEMDGLEAARVIRDQHPKVGVIMLTAYDDRQFVVEAVRSGARGYVLKARDAEHLIQTVRLVAGGNMVIDPQLVVALAEELSTAKERDRKAETLTAREIEVLQLLAFGHTNRDIAERLYISPDTVKTHLEHIFEKLGASDRTAPAAGWASSSGGARTAARVMEPGMAFGHHEGSWTRRSPVDDRPAWRPFSQRSRSSRLFRR